MCADCTHKFDEQEDVWLSVNQVGSTAESLWAHVCSRPFLAGQGVALCLQCSGAHRALGTDVSGDHVRTLALVADTARSGVSYPLHPSRCVESRGCRGSIPHAGCIVRREESKAVCGQAFTARNNAKVNAELEYFVPDNYVKPGLCPRWHA